MKSYKLDEYQGAGCPQYKFVGAVEMAVYMVMDGKVCDTGCPNFDFGACPAYKKLTKKKQPVPKRVLPIYTETVRQESERRGIGIKQVRRERNAKANKEVTNDY